MKLMKLIILLLTVAILNACETSQTTSTEPPISSPAGETEFKEVLPCLGLKLVADTQTSPDKVIFSVVTKNLCDERLEYFLGYEPPHEVIVMRGDIEVWRFTRNDPVADPLADKSYEPGEGESFDAEWRFVNTEGDSVLAGDYEVKGLLISASLNDNGGEPVETPSLRIKIGK